MLVPLSDSVGVASVHNFILTSFSFLVLIFTNDTYDWVFPSQLVSPLMPRKMPVGVDPAASLPLDLDLDLDCDLSLLLLSSPRPRPRPSSVRFEVFPVAANASCAGCPCPLVLLVAGMELNS